jgi:hypothetical protein
MDVVTVQWWFKNSLLDLAETIDVDRSKYRDDEEFDQCMSDDAQAWIESTGFSSSDADEWGWKIV